MVPELEEANYGCKCITSVESMEVHNKIEDGSPGTYSSSSFCKKKEFIERKIVQTM